MEKDNEKLKTDYIKSVGAYMEVWCDKHGFEYDDTEWIGDDVGTIYLAGDYFIGFNDVRYDIDNNLDEPVFLEWYDYCVDIHEFDYERNVTLAAYSKGYRPYTEEQMEDLRRTKAKIRALERDLEEKIREYKRGK